MVGQLRRSSGLATPLLALVLLFRLLIPGGYMIAQDPAGRPGLVLCAAAGGAAAQRARHEGHDRHPAEPSPAKPGELPCPFAALAAPPLPLAPPAILPPTPIAAAAPAAVPNEGLRRPALAAPPPPATGPPLSV